ncbi:uncharacterized protein LOC119101909 [Pollicipes pollicipes]|uniref:uncharacterized protein LOC119101909 n=1 Tax=Pollicipes pollicipes TaxID=41117 RepID=UPI0018857D85|nr:uncharacterized protein LOC119101909 [Pollicipes pollicipes]
MPTAGWQDNENMMEIAENTGAQTPIKPQQPQQGVPTPSEHQTELDEDATESAAANYYQSDFRQAFGGGGGGVLDGYGPPSGYGGSAGPYRPAERALHEDPYSFTDDFSEPGER